MKKIFTVLLLLALCLSLAVPALADAEPDYTELADKLNSVGLFLGTDAGYELESVPTRAQALTMLLRLTGREAEAAEYEGGGGFDDCAGHWAERGIAYSRAAGLAQGRSETQFAPDAEISARDYLTLALRALGYAEGEDFTWQSPFGLAVSVGLIAKGEYADGGAFLRGDCVYVTYNALRSTLKGTQTRLINQLIDMGAVDLRQAVDAGLADSPRSPYASVPILMYHQVMDFTGDNQSLYLSPAHFQEHLDYFEEAGITPVTMRQLYDHWRYGEALPEKLVVLTFDDGYRTMYTEVFPRLAEKGYSGTFFVIAGARWSDNSLDGDMIREMADSGMEIGSHTLTHMELTSLGAAELERELTQSKAVLEEITGRSAEFLCYPVGKNSAAVRAAAGEAGYLAAVTTDYGFAKQEQDVFRLTRIRVNRGCGASWLRSELARIGY